MAESSSKSAADSGSPQSLSRTLRSLKLNYAGSSLPQSSSSLDDLPKILARILNQGSCVMSMDFHPVQQTILVVGTKVGEIGIWEVGSKERLAQRAFQVWDISACSMPMQAALVKDPVVAVNRTIWSPDGTFLGVAFSKHVVHLYAYHLGGDLHPHHEIDAHVGSVNDIAFSHPNKQLCIITCGDDKTIKVWDASTGHRQYTFEGHDAAVYSVCPHHKENIQIIFSTAIDGKIKAWLYDRLGSRVDYVAPGHWCTTMAYSADGKRLFSCGTSKEGESFLVEWNESEGAIKRAYSGFQKRSSNVVQFDTTKNRFLAVGDEFLIKFWDMDNAGVLTSIDAEGGLPASPRLRFNKEGSLLAVTTNDNGIKILSNSDGLRLLRTFESRAFEGGKVFTDASAISKNGVDSNRVLEAKPRVTDERSERGKNWKLTEINDHCQCRTIKLPDTLPASKVSRLIYTNSGVAILALASNAVHKLWKWQRNERNISGKASATIAPQLWQPCSGILMTNDISEANPEEAVPCLALSKNDSYVMSASGGKISLFNMTSFQVLVTFMPPPPAATFLAFHPQDDSIIAIGMEDSTIEIYNVRVEEVKRKLKGHSKKISGLSFSNALNVLVSSGADSQIIVWSIDGWEKRRSKTIQIPAGRGSPNARGDTKVQFHNDYIHLLVVHETQLAIYDASKLERVRQWVPRDPFPSTLSAATYSCDSQLVYASFSDGSVGVMDGQSLLPRCRVASSAYISQGMASANIYPLVVAAHPSEPLQFALGLSDGSVQVLEPLETDGKWGTGPSSDDGAVVSTPSSSAVENQNSE